MSVTCFFRCLGEGTTALAVRGPLSREDDARLHREIRAHIALGQRQQVFADLSGLSRTEVTGQDMAQAAFSLELRAKEAGLTRRVAVFAPHGSYAAGIARMIEGFCAPMAWVEAAAFDDPDAALGWLGVSLDHLGLQVLPGWVPLHAAA